MPYKDHQQGIERKRRYYQEHKAEIEAKRREYLKEHRAQYLAAEKIYREEHKKEAKEYQKQYRATHKETKNAYQRGWNTTHHGSKLASVQKWAHTPSGAAYLRNKTRREQEERRAGGHLDMDAFYAKCERLGWRCQICGRELTRETVTVDHIAPCKYGGTNEIDNLQPLCKSCNSRKGAKPMKEMLGSEFLFG